MWVEWVERVQIRHPVGFVFSLGQIRARGGSEPIEPTEPTSLTATTTRPSDGPPRVIGLEWRPADRHVVKYDRAGQPRCCSSPDLRVGLAGAVDYPRVLPAAAALAPDMPQRYSSMLIVYQRIQTCSAAAVARGGAETRLAS